MSRRACPDVRLWRIVLEDGRVFHVQAPTRLLARLNLRAHPGNWGAIKSCGMLRNRPLAGLPMVQELQGETRA